MHNTVQSHGCLIAADVRSGFISHVSANCADFLGVEAQSLQDQTLADVLGDVVLHDINNVLCHSTSRTQRAAAGSMSASSGSLDMAVHLRARIAIVELQPRRGPAEDGTAALERMRWLLTRVDSVLSAERFVQEATHLLRTLSGHHRVLAYHFDQQGARELVAESCESLAEPFPGTGYPNHEGKPPFVTEWPGGAVRHIADTGADDVQLLTLDTEQEPLNMSLAVLRGVQPEYRE